MIQLYNNEVDVCYGNACIKAKGDYAKVIAFAVVLVLVFKAISYLRN